MQRYIYRPGGFTLIELMIVVAIMGILATMAMPTYQERVIKAQVTEGLQLVEFAKEGVAAFYKANKRMPANNAEAGLPPAEKISGNFVVSVEVAEGALHIKFGNRINKNASGKVLSVRPSVVQGYTQVPISWNCGTATAPPTLKTFGSNLTSLPAYFLPVDCR